MLITLAWFSNGSMEELGNFLHSLSASRWKTGQGRQDDADDAGSRCSGLKIHDIIEKMLQLMNENMT